MKFSFSKFPQRKTNFLFCRAFEEVEMDVKCCTARFIWLLGVDEVEGCSAWFLWLLEVDEVEGCSAWFLWLLGVDEVEVNEEFVFCIWSIGENIVSLSMQMFRPVWRQVLKYVFNLWESKTQFFNVLKPENTPNHFTLLDVKGVVMCGCIRLFFAMSSTISQWVCVMVFTAALLTNMVD